MKGLPPPKLDLSNYIRYLHPIVLLYVLSYIVNPEGLEEILDSIPTYITIPTTLIVGIVLYTLHRYSVIPLHHIFLCFMFYIWNLVRGKHNDPEKVLSPTRYLYLGFGIPFGKRIMYYTVLRRSDFFPNRETLNVDHAKNGIFVMTGTGVLIAALILYFNPQLGSGSRYFFNLFGLCYLISYVVAWYQHSRECQFMRANPNRIEEIFKRQGLPFKRRK